MLPTFRRFLADTSAAAAIEYGAAAAIEYGLIAAFIALAILAALQITGTKLVASLTTLLNAFP